jgi:signal transduction histidine kinase/ligand-binding sensor domain-containing protein
MIVLQLQVGRVFAVAAAGWLCVAAAPAESATNTAAWYARSWQSDDGLPNNSVSGLAQTPDGYLWLGTPTGLVRFDGIEFEEFAPGEFIEPPDRGITTMLPGADGSLWLAMDRGAVVHLNGGSSRVFRGRLPRSIPNGLAEDSQGDVWVTYRGGAVYRINGGGDVSAAGPEHGFPAGTDICAITTDLQRRTWFAKAGWFGMISNGVFHGLHRVDLAPARLAPSRDGGVWLCVGFQLLKLSVAGQLQEVARFHADRGGTVVTDMLEDRQGAVWVGTTFSGLFRFGEAGFESIETTNEEIQSLLEDHEGNLWVGTRGGGLNRVSRRAITLEGPEIGLPFPAVQSICQDSEGTIWAATQNGALVRRTPGGWAPMPEQARGPREVTCLTADPRGGLWLGTRLDGLWSWRDGEFNQIAERGGIRGQTLHTLLVSRSGELWLGEENPPCVQRFRDGEFRTYLAPPDSRVIRAMTEDAAGNIWAGTSRGVLLRISGDTLTEVTPRPLNELASIRTLHATPDGALWIGYAGWGLGRVKEGNYLEIRSEHGLYDDYLSQIVSDHKGWFWFGANRGIFKARERDLVAVAEGRLSRVRSIHYGRGEGLSSLQATFGSSPNALRSRDGRLWLPMRTGLAVVDHRELRENFQPPRALLRGVAVDDRPVAWYPGVLPPKNPLVEIGSPSKVRLLPQHRHIEFRFCALNFSAPESIQFRYRLEGFEEDWVEAGTRRTANYSRLAAGTYNFRVAACNTRGQWSEQTAVLSLVVSPFFHQTLWFRAGAVTIFTLLVVALVRYVSFRRLRRRLERLEAREALHKERARIAKDIHDDVGANLTQIALLGELARQDNHQGQPPAERMARISGAAREAIKSLDEIVWAVNPRNDTLAHLVDYTGQYTLDFLTTAGVRCRLDLPEQTPACELSTDVRHNLFLIVKEALNNIVKYARAGTVWLRMQVHKESLLLEIEDDGCGFDPAPLQEGADGLGNMRQRAEAVGGRFELVSHSGAGTKVRVTMSLPIRTGELGSQP